VYNSTLTGRLSRSSALMAAVSSMMLFVVRCDLPLSSNTLSFHIRMALHPPGPGLPEQAPSVYMRTGSVGKGQAHRGGNQGFSEISLR